MLFVRQLPFELLGAAASTTYDRWRRETCSTHASQQPTNAQVRPGLCCRAQVNPGPAQLDCVAALHQPEDQHAGGCTFIIKHILLAILKRLQAAGLGVINLNALSLRERTALFSVLFFQIAFVSCSLFPDRWFEPPAVHRGLGTDSLNAATNLDASPECMHFLRPPRTLA